MNDASLHERLAPQARVMQIILTAMVVVPLLFGVIAVVLSAQPDAEPAPIQGALPPEPEGTGGLLPTLALGIGLAALFAQQVVGNQVTEQGVKQALGDTQADGDRAESLAGALMTGSIVSGAINEGAAFFALITHMIEPSPWCLSIATILILSNLLKVPTLDRIVVWVESQQRRLTNA